jgi:S-adenosylmethionine:tRNA ribosyltransferase-isomerase
MKLNDFDYNLPENLIAKYPAKRRDESRLLVLNKKTGAIQHGQFTDIRNYLKRGDVLVVNNSKVFPARIVGQKKSTGGRIEILLNHQLDNSAWEVIGKGLKAGLEIIFENSRLEAKVLSKDDATCQLVFNIDGQDFFNEIERIGQVPLPPYIEKNRDANDFDDKSRYQTVYAKDFGSAAAPTAGLHFTKELLQQINLMGVMVLEVTLHVGLGTFSPVKVDDIKSHKMHREYYSADKETIEKIIDAKSKGHKIFAVGTTATRVLETIYSQISSSADPQSSAVFSGWTEIFIYPGYKFKCVDALITNFHTPESTLLMLVSAMATREKILNAYKEAIKEEYRFFSYGDAMLII